MLRVTMPKWGLSMREGRVVSWLVDEGATVAPGDELCEAESDKINGVVEATGGGILRRRLAVEGDLLPVGGLLGVIADTSTPDGEIDALIAEFEATFVPPAEDDAEDAAPQSVTVGGLELSYALRGEGGEPLVLLHGFGGDKGGWLFNHEALAAGRAVYAFDLPGHGDSSKAVVDGSPDALAATLAGAFDVLGIERAHVVGHSLGGLVTMLLAITHARVARATLIAPAGLGPEIDAGYLDGFIAAAGRNDLRPLLQRLYADPAVVTRQVVDDVLKIKRRDGVGQALRTIADGFVSDGRQARIVAAEYAATGLPTTVIVGSADAIIPPEHANALAGSATIELIDGAGHMPMMEAAGAVNRLIDR